MMSDTFIQCDTTELLNQIGMWSVLATSGGRVIRRETGITLPVRYGYRVTIDLAAGDTYTVRRLFVKDGKTWIKGELSNVYCDQVGDIVYAAGCYRDPFPS